jgi:aminoglycoside phosphotransferase (APT) family kinase protein
MFESIPAARRDAARAALETVFGATPLSSLQPITTGASALIYRIEAGGRPHLLRLESPLRDTVRDPQRSYLCMRMAAEAGIAPPLLHADADAGVAIMAFVAGCPLADYPAGAGALAAALGALTARLQATPAFPAVTGYRAILAGMFDRLVEAGLYGDGLLAPHRDGFERVCDAYPWDASAAVSSHNDPHPGNILFDGTRLWLIDWETAYRNDPVVDVAVMTLYIAASPETQEALVRSWLGRPSDPMLRARLVLMRQLVRLFYGLANGLHAAAARPGLIETDLAAPTPAAFRAAIDRGRLIPNSIEAQRLGGKVALRTFIEGLAAPAFAAAVDVVRRGS